jgi:outer membrane protein TolC
LRSCWQTLALSVALTASALSSCAQASDPAVTTPAQTPAQAAADVQATTGVATAPAASASGALPDAPSLQVSAQRSQQDEALTRDPGSKLKLTLATVPGPGVAIELPQAGPLKLSIDDAISLGLDRNVLLKYDRANQKAVRGYIGSIVEAVLPNLRATGSTSAQQINLAAMGFKPANLAAFGINPATFPTIVRVNVTQAQLSANQVLFSLTDYELLKGARSEVRILDLQTLNSEGDVVQSVATQYLRVLADQANVANAQALELSAKTTFDQATQKLQAGVGIRLDALRGQVEYQQRQQGTLAALASLAKDTIQLNRIMGLPAGQELELTDAVPFQAFDDMDLERAKDTAFRHRKDYLGIAAQLDLEDREERAVRYQRLPTLAFNGFYGVIGQTTGSYHGDFVAEGTLQLPIFREAAQRGEQDSIRSQRIALAQRQQALRVDIDAQIRSSMLDVAAAHELVMVAQSNVKLAEQELSDERERFKAGVDDNLPVVDAEASLAGAEAQTVQAMFQYNVAKLGLARNTGVVESRYRVYLGTQ